MMIMAINKRIRNNKGFTLIELIVVLAVLGILAAIAVPRLTGVKADAAEKADVAAATNVGKAAEMYVEMNGVPAASKRTLIEDGKDKKGNKLIKKGYVSKDDLKCQVKDEDDKDQYFTVKVEKNDDKLVINVYRDTAEDPLYTSSPLEN